ncbi:type II secretion system F family protein, partial [Campylobacter jejuni]|nr:type II secretion system F family protein [Campylobacter jejuni]
MKFYEVEFLKNNQNYTKTIKAENLNIAQTKALSKNWKIIDIKEIQKSNFQRLKDENFILFFKELALLCEVGLSVQEAIKELYLMHSCKIMKKILDNLILAQNLNQAFENANFGLNRAELALIKTAEKTGKISEVFSQISKLREKSLESQKQLKKAFRYPTLVFLSIIGAFLFLMLFVVPNFKDLFENLGASLPFITHVMLEIYNFLDSYGIFCIFLFVVFIV